MYNECIGLGKVQCFANVFCIFLFGDIYLCIHRGLGLTSFLVSLELIILLFLFNKLFPPVQLALKIVVHPPELRFRATVPREFEDNC